MMMQFSELRWARTWMPGVILVLTLLVGRCRAMTLHAVFDPWLGSSSHVLDDEGMLWSWGRNTVGELGDGTTNASVNAVKIALPPGVARWTQFEAGAGFALLDDQGRLYGWGRTESEGNVIGPTQTSPLRLSDLRWKQVALPSMRSGLAGVPWGLGITEAGELRWIRIRSPLAPGDAPFSNRSIEPVTGVDGALKFRAVAGGFHMYLALAESGKLYACGVGSWGVLGPNGNLGSTQFNTTFVEVPAPEVGGGWDRIGVAGTQSFGWTQDGELYVWGRRFEGQSNLNWGWVTDPTPRHVPRAPDGSAWIRVDGYGESETSTTLQNESGQLWLAGEGLDLIWGRKLYRLPGGWSPVRGFSTSPRHSLYLGSDGVVRAIGDNEDFQLGGFPVGAPLEYPPVIPGGDAPFLLGKRASVPVLKLSASERVIVEPAGESTVGIAPVKVTLTREERLDLTVFASFEIRLRRADGSLVPGVESSAWLREMFVLSSQLVVIGAGETQVSLTLTPKRALKRDEDLKIEVELMPHPSFEIAGDAVKDFDYRHTMPTNYPPSVEVLWPRPGWAVQVGDYLELVFRVKDVDGVATQAKFRWNGLGFGGSAAPAVMDLEPVAVGAEKTYALKIPRAAFVGAYGPELTIQVYDNTGESTVLDFGVVNVKLARPHQLDLQLGGRLARLTLGSAGIKVALESSEDLVTWNVERTYGFPSPGLPKTPVDFGGEGSSGRYFRLRNVE